MTIITRIGQPSKKKNMASLEIFLKKTLPFHHLNPTMWLWLANAHPPCSTVLSNAQVKNLQTAAKVGSWKLGKMIVGNDSHLEPQTTIYKWLFQLDDSQSLHGKWLFHQTSIYKWLFGVPGTCLICVLQIPKKNLSKQNDADLPSFGVFCFEKSKKIFQNKTMQIFLVLVCFVSKIQKKNFQNKTMQIFLVLVCFVSKIQKKTFKTKRCRSSFKLNFMHIFFPPQTPAFHRPVCKHRPLHLRWEWSQIRSLLGACFLGSPKLGRRSIFWEAWRMGIPALVIELSWFW